MVCPKEEDQPHKTARRRVRYLLSVVQPHKQEMKLVNVQIVIHTSVSVVFMCPCDVTTRDNPPPHHHHHPPPLPPESTTQNNAHFNMCRGARYSIVLTVWNIRHITSCILPLPGRWLQRRIVSGVSRNLLSGRHFYLLLIQHWFFFLIVRTFEFESNSKVRIHVSLCIWLYPEKWYIFHSVIVTLRSRLHRWMTYQWEPKSFPCLPHNNKK